MHMTTDVGGGQLEHAVCSRIFEKTWSLCSMIELTITSLYLNQEENKLLKKKHLKKSTLQKVRWCGTGTRYWVHTQEM
jgi:hypothetical protein